MVDRIVDNVVDRVAVLLLGFDHLRPEAPAEDVIAAPVTLVEGSGVNAVQVAHAVGEIGFGGLDDQVIVIAEQAADCGAQMYFVSSSLMLLLEKARHRLTRDTREDAIERLKELRTSLISATVTGKIDVREEAA